MRHDRARGNLVPDIDVEESTHTLLEFFFESLIDDEAVLVGKPPPAEKQMLGKALLRGKSPPSVVADAGEGGGRDRFAEYNRASILGTPRANDSKAKGDGNVFTHHPRDPNCELCR